MREDERTDGVALAWGVLAAAVAALTVIAVMGADRLSRRLVGASADLVRAAVAVGRGELGVGVRVDGPHEVREVATAFNTMTEQIIGLMQAEREFAADLSHRLRTPLTALKLDLDLYEGLEADRLRAAVAALDREVTDLIGRTRAGSAEMAAARPGCSDLIEVVGARMPFWEALADAQGRPCTVTIAAGPLTVGLAEEDLVTALDALLGNVFRHTPAGTGCEVYAGPLNGVPSLVVEDCGPGIARYRTAQVRGHSGGESSGLGLDIVARAADGTGGRLVVGTSRRGGARVEMRLGRHRPTILGRSSGASPGELL
ncbi:HAMP domain-containing sensor histidine kinase [Streptomyces collinus]|uniref:HAMP domain-containing sensor histidine kinase n=1 Tax=Streptomyces collinus TaxID=42684 RepID=UPI003328B184